MILDLVKNILTKSSYGHKEAMVDPSVAPYTNYLQRGKVDVAIGNYVRNIQHQTNNAYRRYVSLAQNPNTPADVLTGAENAYKKLDSLLSRVKDADLKKILQTAGAKWKDPSSVNMEQAFKEAIKWKDTHKGLFNQQKGWLEALEQAATSAERKGQLGIAKKLKGEVGIAQQMAQGLSNPKTLAGQINRRGLTGEAMINPTGIKERVYSALFGSGQNLKDITEDLAKGVNKPAVPRAGGTYSLAYALSGRKPSKALEAINDVSRSAKIPTTAAPVAEEVAGTAKAAPKNIYKTLLNVVKNNPKKTIGGAAATVAATYGGYKYNKYRKEKDAAAQAAAAAAAKKDQYLKYGVRGSAALVAAILAGKALSGGSKRRYR